MGSLVWFALGGEDKGFASACGAPGVVSPSKMGRFRVDEETCTSPVARTAERVLRMAEETTRSKKGASHLKNSEHITFECTLPCDRVRETFSVLETTMASR